MNFYKLLYSMLQGVRKAAVFAFETLKKPLHPLPLLNYFMGKAKSKYILHMFTSLNKYKILPICGGEIGSIGK